MAGAGGGVGHACLQAALAAARQLPTWDLDPYLEGGPLYCEGTLSPGVSHLRHSCSSPAVDIAVPGVGVGHACLQAALAAARQLPAWGPAWINHPCTAKALCHQVRRAKGSFNCCGERQDACGRASSIAGGFAVWC